MIYNLDLIGSTPKIDDVFFIKINDEVLCKNTKNILLPTFEDLKEEKLENIIYLFSFENKNIYFAKIEDLKSTNFSKVTLRQIINSEKPNLVSIGLTANHLTLWYDNNKFCSKCGKPFNKSQKERALTCNCGYTAYPTISPAIIVAITDKENLLLTKYASGEYQNYSLVAGYVEVGETLEECVIREVYEEVGLKVKNIKYFDSQPWGLTHSLLVGFSAELEGSEEITLDTNELREGIWLDRNLLPSNPASSTLTWKMIHYFKEGNKF